MTNNNNPMKQPKEGATMSRDEIVELLRGELALMPGLPEQVTESDWRDYDETLYDSLEALRDACAYIVKQYDKEVQR